MLRVVVGSRIIAEVPVNEKHFTIGRSADCSLLIDDKKASRIHAQIVHVNGQGILEDMGSSNGTLVNNTPVTKKILASGDEIQIGDTFIRFKK